MLIALADLFDEGQEEIAKVASKALRREAGTELQTEPAPLSIDHAFSEALSADDAHPAASAVLAAMDQIHWRFSGLADGRIRKEIALHMGTCELLGPHGMIAIKDCRVGLFAQCRGVDYPTRIHAAEEIFLMLGGEAEWSQSEKPYLVRRPGDRIHHASMEPHKSRSMGFPMIAAWAWRGEIGYDRYNLVE